MMSDYDLPVNIGNPDRNDRCCEFAEEIIRATGSRSKIVFKPLPQDDPKQRKPDITKAKKILKWEPKVAAGARPHRHHCVFQDEDLDLSAVVRLPTLAADRQKS